MVVETTPGGQAEIRQNLELVLEIRARFFRTIVTVGIALEIRGCNEAVRCVRRYQPLQKLREIGEPDRALVRSQVPCVELGVVKNSAKGQRGPTEGTERAAR